MHKSNKRYKLHSVVSRACKANAYHIDIWANLTAGILASASIFDGKSGKEEYHWGWKHNDEWLTGGDVSVILQQIDITVCVSLKMVD